MWHFLLVLWTPIKTNWYKYWVLLVILNASKKVQCWEYRFKNYPTFASSCKPAKQGCSDSCSILPCSAMSSLSSVLAGCQLVGTARDETPLCHHPQPIGSNRWILCNHNLFIDIGDISDIQRPKALWPMTFSYCCVFHCLDGSRTPKIWICSGQKTSWMHIRIYTKTPTWHLLQSGEVSMAQRDGRGRQAESCWQSGSHGPWFSDRPIGRKNQKWHRQHPIEIWDTTTNQRLQIFALPCISDVSAACLMIQTCCVERIGLHHRVFPFHLNHLSISMHRCRCCFINANCTLVRSVQTLWNHNFVNPNAMAAARSWTSRPIRFMNLHVECPGETYAISCKCGQSPVVGFHRVSPLRRAMHGTSSALSVAHLKFQHFSTVSAHWNIRSALRLPLDIGGTKWHCGKWE